MTSTQAPDLQAKDTPPTVAAKIGRPSTYNLATTSIICERIAGGETLTKVCRTPGMPTKQTVHRWRMKYPAFNVQYTQARVTQMESFADEILEIADDSTADTVTKITPQGREYEAVDHEAIQRDRLRVDTRKFLMSKVAHHIYGDRVQHEHSGEVVQRVELADRERMRLFATFLLEDKAAGVTIEGVAAELTSHTPDSPTSEQEPPTTLGGVNE